MLPPPTTRHSSCPCPFAAAISPASPATASGSMPNWPWPINASPESFSRIRLKRGRVMRVVGPQDVTRAATLYGAAARLPTALLARARVWAQHRSCRGLRMASVFLSYDHDDRDKARPIALALQKAGHSVWWDLHVRGGTQFSKVIEDALKAADAVVVLWSRNSVESAWVRDEAAAGRDTGRLVPATIDGTEAPLGFRQFQTIDVRDWKRGARGRGCKELEQTIAETVTEPDSAKEESRSPAIPPATSSNDRRRAGRQWLTAAALMLAVLAAGLAAWRFSGRTSSVPVIAVTAADQSSSSQALARDLLAKLGSLQTARTDALELVGAPGSDPSRASFIFQASASGAPTRSGANLVLLAGRDRSLLW